MWLFQCLLTSSVVFSFWFLLNSIFFICFLLVDVCHFVVFHNFIGDASVFLLRIRYHQSTIRSDNWLVLLLLPVFYILHATPFCHQANFIPLFFFLFFTFLFFFLLSRLRHFFFVQPWYGRICLSIYFILLLFFRTFHVVPLMSVFISLFKRSATEIKKKLKHETKSKKKTRKEEKENICNAWTEYVQFVASFYFLYYFVLFIFHTFFCSP